MYKVLHHGVDTLDIAFQGAFSDATLKALDVARHAAETTNKDQPLAVGPGAVPVVVKPNGMKGGFRYVFNNGPTGAIFAAKANSSLKEWNLFVSIRALRLLTLGYAGTKAWLHETLAGMGFIVTDVSVNRIDFAVDILAPDFVLDIANFVAPGQAKARPYWSKEQLLETDGDRPHAVLRGRTFESVTIGTMPNRQVIVYDKRRAAIDQRQPYWFEVWGVDPHDPGARVWRVEIRAGRDALAKVLLKRSYEAVEHELRSFLLKATREIRYIVDKDRQRNITRSTVHPMWNTLASALSELPLSAKPPMPEARALNIIRRQREDMARKQAFGNLQNAFVLEGLSPEDIARDFPAHAARAAKSYVANTGADQIARKTTEIGNRLHYLRSGPGSGD